MKLMKMMDFFRKTFLGAVPAVFRQDQYLPENLFRKKASFPSFPSESLSNTLKIEELGR